MLELDHILLNLLTDIGQYYIVMTLMFMSTKLAVKRLIDLAAILYFSIFVVFAEESLRVIRESFNFIKDFLITLYFFRTRTEFLESVHWIIIWIIS